MAAVSSSLVSMLNASTASGPASMPNPPPNVTQSAGFSDVLKSATSERTAVDEPARMVKDEPRAPADAVAVKANVVDAKKPAESVPAEKVDAAASGDEAADEDHGTDDGAGAKRQTESSVATDGQQVKQDPLAAMQLTKVEAAPAGNELSAALAAKVASSEAEPVDEAESGDDEASESRRAPGASPTDAALTTSLTTSRANAATALATPGATAETQAQPQSALGTALGAHRLEPEFTTAARAAELEKTVAAAKDRQPSEAVRSFADLLDQASGKVTPDATGRSDLMAPIAARAATAAPGQALPIGAALHEADWGGAVAKRVTWMVGKDVQHAELRLDPPELGRINVRISMSQDQATVSFASPHGTVREAVEAALPKLRDMLAENGYTLANVDISSHFQQRQGEQPGRKNGSGNGSNYGADGEPEIVASVVQLTSDGLIDAYV